MYIPKGDIMAKQSIQAIVLAAGKSSRFNTGRSKLLERLCGQEMILYPVKVLEELKIETTLVVGYQAEAIKKAIAEYNLNTVSFVHQTEQNGTGHAVAQTKAQWNQDTILILNGDMPLVDKTILEELIQTHETSDATISFVTAHNADPNNAYGRVIKKDNQIQIIEAKDFNGDPAEQCCINAGVYVFKRSFLEKHIDLLSAKNAAKEYYLTDLINIAQQENEKIETIKAPFDHVRGINTLREFWTAEQIKRSELIRFWMDNGVRFYAAQSVVLDANTEIGKGSHIHAGVHLLSGTTIGKNCTIGPYSVIENGTVADNTIIKAHSVVSDATIEQSCQIGPFAHVYEKSTIAEKSIIGNFVEVKRTNIGSNTKAKHLTYLGDARIGNKVNIGAGTITCNHNGVGKNETHIADNAFIGSNNTLVAPVRIGAGAFTAGGSVITKDVPSDALAIGRARQINKEGYAHRLLSKEEQSTNSNQTEPNDTPSFIAATKSVDDSSTPYNHD